MRNIEKSKVAYLNGFMKRLWLYEYPKRKRRVSETEGCMLGGAEPKFVCYVCFLCSFHDLPRPVEVSIAADCKAREAGGWKERVSGWTTLHTHSEVLTT